MMADIKTHWKCLSGLGRADRSLFKTKRKFKNLSEEYKTRQDRKTWGLQQSATDAMIINLFTFLAIYIMVIMDNGIHYTLYTDTNSNLIPT